MTRKLFISLVINVPWAVWIYSFTRYNPDLPIALMSLEPLLYTLMLWGSGAMLGLTFKLYFPDTTRWTHILILSAVWALSIFGAVAGPLFITAVPVSIFIAMRLMQTKRYLTVGIFLFLSAEISAVVLFTTMIRRAARTDDGLLTENIPIWLLAGAVGALYALAVHVMVVGGEKLKRVVITASPTALSLTT